MKNFLNYQSTEYDCGPVSMMNGVRYLFERNEIYPDVVKFIHLYCMDKYNENGELCKSGTSHSVMRFLTHWLNNFRECKDFPIECECLEKEEVDVKIESQMPELKPEAEINNLPLLGEDVTTVTGEDINNAQE